MNEIQFFDGRWVPYWEKSRHLRGQVDAVIPKIDDLLRLPTTHTSWGIMKIDIFRKLMARRLHLSRKLKPKKYRRFLEGVR